MVMLKKVRVTEHPFEEDIGGCFRAKFMRLTQRTIVFR